MQENAFHIVWALIWNGSLTFAMEKRVPAMILPGKDGEGWQERVTRIKGIVKRSNSGKISFWRDLVMERSSYGTI